MGTATTWMKCFDISIGWTSTESANSATVPRIGCNPPISRFQMPRQTWQRSNAARESCTRRSGRRKGSCRSSSIACQAWRKTSRLWTQSGRRRLSIVRRCIRTTRMVWGCTSDHAPRRIMRSLARRLALKPKGIMGVVSWRAQCLEISRTWEARWPHASHRSHRGSFRPSRMVSHRSRPIISASESRRTSTQFMRRGFLRPAGC
mmetsp:Transcript_82345/g.176337  ORF Transcript_82345/g.176337 Transcript_82345/m.176337 type:complete len:204 (-) Transcript_82345:415-1026(-)